MFGNDLKGKALARCSTSLGIALAFVEPWLGLVPFVVVALIWLVPDRRIERYLRRQRELRQRGRLRAGTARSK